VVAKARTAGGRLSSREDLPTVVAGCRLTRGDVERSTYAIDSHGPLGGHHVAVFQARSDTAEIVTTKKHGWFGTQRHDVPTERHIQALRDLGFEEVAFPSGRRYELRTWPGIRRVRSETSG